jgi:hypothetical protein
MDAVTTMERTQVWMQSNSSLSELGDRINVMLAAIEADGGSVCKVKVIVTPMSPDVVLYTAWILYREQIVLDEE